MATKRQVDLQNAMERMRLRVSMEKQKEVIATNKRKLEMMRADYKAKHPTARRNRK